MLPLSTLQNWAQDLGFSHVSVIPVGLHSPQFALHDSGLNAWLAAGHHGEMAYMAAHGSKRSHPAELLEGTQTVLSLRMNYLPSSEVSAWQAYETDDLGTQATLQKGLGKISRYAQGRDYHKVVRHRLQKLLNRITAHTPCSGRVFSDSAPVMEVALALQAAHNLTNDPNPQSAKTWRGKNTLLLSSDAGSLFFLGEIFLSIPVQVAADVAVENTASTATATLQSAPPTHAADHAQRVNELSERHEPGGDDPNTPAPKHCGSCTACIRACPTGAILGPQRLDARRCISYLTIELKGSIPPEFRRAIGNRVYGCDDCQSVCPWNKYAQAAHAMVAEDFAPRPHWQNPDLVSLFNWSEEEFLRHTEGSAIRRIGYVRWLRNLSVSLGNALAASADALLRSHIQQALQDKKALLPAISLAEGDAALLTEHIDWAMAQATEPS